MSLNWVYFDVVGDIFFGWHLIEDWHTPEIPKLVILGLGVTAVLAGHSAMYTFGSLLVNFLAEV